MLRRMLVALIAAPLLILGAAAPVQADAGMGRQLNCREGYDFTGGAYGEVCLYQDLTTGAVYGGSYFVADTKADGKCAHVRLIWWHVNGNGYYDPHDDPHRYYVCGYLGGEFYPPTPARNFNMYTSVHMQVYVDGGHAKSYLLWS
ncbi:MAG TPA: hypothetical protein VIL37_20300 [Natronosporangium sp.]